MNMWIYISKSARWRGTASFGIALFQTSMQSVSPSHVQHPGIFIPDFSSGSFTRTPNCMSPVKLAAPFAFIRRFVSVYRVRWLTVIQNRSSPAVWSCEIQVTWEPELRELSVETQTWALRFVVLPTCGMACSGVLPPGDRTLSVTGSTSRRFQKSSRTSLKITHTYLLKNK